MKVVTINSISVKPRFRLGLDVMGCVCLSIYLLYFSYFFIVNEFTPACVNCSQAG